MILPVTYLFVPATDEHKASKALQSGADAVIMDLEDSIPDGVKQTAREHLRKYINSRQPTADSPQVWVRINGTGPDFTADAESVPWDRVTGAVLPKAERAGSVQTLLACGAARVLPIIETAAGFRMLDRLVNAGGIERFAIGTLDLAIDLGIIDVEADDSELIWQLRGELVLASRQLHLPAPVDGVHIRFDDDAGLWTLSQRAHHIGYAAKLMIHPRQIPIVQSVFRPDEKVLQHARDVVQAYEAALHSGRGAVQLSGEMIDRPVVERARALLARWSG